MRIEAFVKTSAKENIIKKKGFIYYISLKSKPFQNRANVELIDIISSYFDISKSSVVILNGLKSRKKLIEIKEE